MDVLDVFMLLQRRSRGMEAFPAFMEAVSSRWMPVRRHCWMAKTRAAEWEGGFDHGLPADRCLARYCSVVHRGQRTGTSWCLSVNNRSYIRPCQGSTAVHHDRAFGRKRGTRGGEKFCDGLLFVLDASHVDT